MIEEAMQTHPGVARAAIVGVADPSGRMGQLIHAFIIPSNKESPITASELIAFISPLLEESNLPDFTTMVDILPLGASNKVDRVELTRHAEGKIALKLTI